MTALLGIPLGAKGSGRDRYGRAMTLYIRGQLNPAQLEVFRVAAAHDRLHPDLFFADRNLPAPDATLDGDTPMTFAPEDRKIANIHDAEFRPFVYPDGQAFGDDVLQLDTDIPLGEGFHVYRMPAGMTTRRHIHNGHEQFLILEGELIEDDGRVLKPGDLVFYRDGTEHHSYTPTGCLLAVHIAGPETPTR